MAPIKYGIVLLALSAYTSAVLACDCTLKQIMIDPIEPTRNDIFVGKANTLELQFRNESTQQVIEVFPEPPLTIRQIASNKQCHIEGGIWVRKSVYLSVDEKTLLVQEYSGSNDQLVLYDTMSCRKKNGIDISDARWKIADNQIIVGNKCSGEEVKTCQSIKRFNLNKFCKPILTKNVF